MKLWIHGGQLGDIWAWDIDKGGKAIPCRFEDPFIRAGDEGELARDGAVSRMEAKHYRPNE